MAETNFKLFDENKVNMLSDQEYNINTQRINGVQGGVASSSLHNKAMYQASLMVNALAQFMVSCGYNASDADAVSTFNNNLASAIKPKFSQFTGYLTKSSGTLINFNSKKSFVMLDFESIDNDPFDYSIVPQIVYVGDGSTKYVNMFYQKLVPSVKLSVDMNGIYVQDRPYSVSKNLLAITID